MSCSWKVRKNNNVVDEGNVAVEWEYLFTNNQIFDLFLISRLVPANIFVQASCLLLML